MININEHLPDGAVQKFQKCPTHGFGFPQSTSLTLPRLLCSVTPISDYYLSVIYSLNAASNPDYIAHTNTMLFVIYFKKYIQLRLHNFLGRLYSMK
jgi:hypothetical protein